MDDFQDSPADQLVAVLMGDGEPNYIPDEVKDCFCKFNNIHMSKNNMKDNFFYVVVKKYLTQLCTSKNIYLKKLERFPVKNLKKANNTFLSLILIISADEKPKRNVRTKIN